MPLAASLRIDGVPGTGIQKGREGDITVTAFSHDISTELDPTFGVPLKTRTHWPLVIRKNLDFATPFLAEAHDKGQVLGDWVLRLFHMPRSGGETHYFTIRLVGARVVKIAMSMPDHTNPEVANSHEYEEVSFTYDSIVWGSEAPANTELDKDGAVKTQSSDVGEFAPDWLNRAAKVGLEKIRDAAVELAKSKYKAELDKIEETGQLPGE